MFRMARRCCRSMRYSRKYGSHPGTLPVAGMIIVGAIVGLERSWLFGLIGAGAMAVLLLPVWLTGCYTRGNIGWDECPPPPPREIQPINNGTGWTPNGSTEPTPVAGANQNAR